MKHTPGPWTACFGWNKEQKTYADIKDVKGNILFQTPDNFKSVEPKKQEKNAGLAAAAPDLLNACKDALNALECNCGEACLGTCSKGIIEKAIKKATDGGEQCQSLK
jgi:hypothetical protein